jgi:hypothetical protein
VRRDGAETYLLVTLMAFGLSVAATRLFLQLAGYPQLSAGQFHIAHVLWGGLALFAAALLPLILANRWVYMVGAVLAGLGVGLFIDEVGKFITSSNDYFYPAAAPIIYAFFVLTVLLYLRIRKPGPKDSRASLYAAFDMMEEVLDRDLEPGERHLLEQRLQAVGQDTEHPERSHLAMELLRFVHSEGALQAEERPDVLERIQSELQAFEARHLSRFRLRRLLGTGWGVLGAYFIVAALADLRRLVDAATLGEGARSLPIVLRQADIEPWNALLQLLIGGLLVIALGQLAFGRDRSAVRLASYSLLLALTVVNLFVFFYDQFSAILPASLELVLLIGGYRYQRRFLLDEPVLLSPLPGDDPPLIPRRG